MKAMDFKLRGILANVKIDKENAILSGRLNGKNVAIDLKKCTLQEIQELGDMIRSIGNTITVQPKNNRRIR